MEQTYTNLSFDADRDWRINILKDTPWAFVNLLPYKIKVYVYRPVKTDLVGVIAPRSTLKTSMTTTGMPLRVGDQIHILRPAKSKSGKEEEYEILRPVFLFDDSRMVRIADIVYEDRVANAPTVDIHHDIVGLRIHNHITMPVDVYYKGLRIGSIAGDDGTDFMAGSPNSVYLNNNRYGFQIGDEIGFVFSHDNMTFATIKINDNFASDIIIGKIVQHYVSHPNDIYSYRVDNPNITGLRYFEQVTGYQSKGNDVIGPNRPYLKVTAVTQGVKL